MKTCLAEFVSIQTGVHLNPSSEGDALYLQAGHFDQQNGSLDPRVRPNVTLDPRQSKHLLLPGDVLFVSKGVRHFAALYQSSMGRAVASPIFLVIRLHSHRKISPVYLTWYLNHPQTQLRLYALAKTATVSSLNRQDLLDFEISLPDLSRQNAIVQVDALRRRESALRRDLQALRENHIQKILLQSIRSPSP